VEQKLPAAQETSMVEQAVPLQPIGTMQSRSPCAVGGAHGAVDVAWRRYSPWIPLQEQPQAGTAGH